MRSPVFFVIILDVIICCFGMRRCFLSWWGCLPLRWGLARRCKLAWGIGLSLWNCVWWNGKTTILNDVLFMFLLLLSWLGVWHLHILLSHSPSPYGCLILLEHSLVLSCHAHRLSWIRWLYRIRCYLSERSFLDRWNWLHTGIYLYRRPVGVLFFFIFLNLEYKWISTFEGETRLVAHQEPMLWFLQSLEAGSFHVLPPYSTLTSHRS